MLLWIYCTAVWYEAMDVGKRWRTLAGVKQSCGWRLFLPVPNLKMISVPDWGFVARAPLHSFIYFVRYTDWLRGSREIGAFERVSHLWKGGFIHKVISPWVETAFAKPSGCILLWITPSLFSMPPEVKSRKNKCLCTMSSNRITLTMQQGILWSLRTV